MSRKIYLIAALIYLDMLFSGALKDLYAAPTADEIVAATLVLEAGGESSEGITAVMNVIHNRHLKRGMSYQAICLQRLQFSCWNGVTDRQKVVDRAKKHSRWEACTKLVVRSKNGGLRSIVGKSSHYHVFRGRSKVSPSWTHPKYGGKNEEAVVVRELGNHVFLVVK
jgi:hypothetical protein